MYPVTLWMAVIAFGTSTRPPRRMASVFAISAVGTTNPQPNNVGH